ncbi:LysE family translocator [Streptomyces phytophilus]|uniref:LysE family translocator n=1 Tax=Streptomyces phytophilus TaxID=722715 RepID=UPI0015F0BBE0|nr:LysE family translocator [Streptomyces phytophilus]
MLATLLAFLGACTLIAATPGPSTVLIIRNSMHSRRAGMMTVLGNETGVFLWGAIAAFGLTALLAASQVAYDVMRWVGAAVLVWFGVQALRAARRGAAAEFADRAGAEVTSWRAYRSGLLLNLANPKVGVFAMSFLPQFVPSSAPQLATTLAFAALWAVYEVGWYAVYVWFVGRLKGVLSRAGVRKRLEQVSGTVLVALGIRLAVEH